MNAHTSITAIATAGTVRERISDDAVISWLGERNCVGPFSAEFLDEMRSHIEGNDFAKRVRDICKEPARLKTFLADLAAIGANDFAEAVAQTYNHAQTTDTKPNDLDTLLSLHDDRVAASDRFHATYVQPAWSRLNSASEAIPTVYATYQSVGGPVTWCSTNLTDVKKAYTFLGIWEVDSEGGTRPVDERRASRNLDHYAAARRIVADDKLRGRKLRRLREDLASWRKAHESVEAKVGQTGAWIKAYQPGTLSELHRKVDYLSDWIEPESFADVMIEDIRRLSAPEGEREHWDTAYAAWTSADKAFDEVDIDSAGASKASDDRVAARYALMLTPAPDHAALSQKLNLLMAEDCCGVDGYDEFLEAIQRDVQLLGGLHG